MLLKSFILQLGLNIIFYSIFCNQLYNNPVLILPLIIHVTFVTMIFNYISCYLKNKHNQKLNPEWFFIPSISWEEFKQSLISDKKQWLIQ